MPRCKNCKDKFTPIRFNMKYCTEIECLQAFTAEIKAKTWTEKKKKWTTELKTTSDWLKDAQKVFNTYIRTRDEGKTCISCNQPINGVKHASHYLSSGGHSNVRFHEDNVWVSCYKCNVMLSGNQIEYRKRLIEKIGNDRVQWLEENGNQVKKWELDELKLLIKIYKKKTKEFNK
jgi:hypothetical protein